MVDDFIENNKDEIIENVQNLIKIPSVYMESNDSRYPFGEKVNNALEFMLNLGKSLGFRTKNVDGYCRIY